MKTLLVRGAVALLAVGLGVPTAHATTVRCQRTIAKASSQFLQAKAKALSACEQRVIANGGGSCPDATATTAIGTATVRLTAAVGKSCGGDDKVCGGDLSNEDLPASLGWPAAFWFVYVLLCVAHTAYLLLAAPKWFRDLARRIEAE